MRFGPVPLTEAEGAILAHSIGLEGCKLKKGRRLAAADITALATAGVAEVLAARLDPGDLGEDEAAAAIAGALAPDPATLGLSVSAPFTGRANLFAAAAGVFRADTAAVAGLDVTSADIAAMGVGGLLKEIPTRPQPRAGASRSADHPRIEAVVLAAGAARRMGGRDKLLEPVAGRPVLTVVTDAALRSRADRVIVVLPPNAAARRAALEGMDVTIVEAGEWAEGMGASLRVGVGRVSQGAGGVVILLADMPEVTAGHIDRLIAAFDPAEGREICRAVAEDGTPGHPVLFGRRFFANLQALKGDQGARAILRGAAEFVVDVPTPGRGAALDLDTPEAWRAWRGGAG